MMADKAILWAVSVAALEAAGDYVE